MTKDEAIKILEEYRSMLEGFMDHDEPAFTMAIESLSADTVSRDEYIKVLEESIWKSEQIGKLLEYQTETAEPKWIPVSERLPKAEDMYQPPEQRYLCQLEAYGEKKFCVLSRLKGAVSPFWDWYGVAVHDSEVTAWMPLPKPYKGGDTE